MLEVRVAATPGGWGWVVGEEPEGLSTGHAHSLDLVVITGNTHFVNVHQALCPYVLCAFLHVILFLKNRK